MGESVPRGWCGARTGSAGQAARWTCVAWIFSTGVSLGGQVTSEPPTVVDETSARPVARDSEPSPAPTVAASDGPRVASRPQADLAHQSEVVLRPTQPVAYSGIYPHTAVTNGHLEVGIGGLLRRDRTLYFVTYGPHITAGGSDKLYALDLDSLHRTTYLDYPGNTNANRYRDSKLGIDVVGAAYLDAASTIRFLPVKKAGELRGRITGTTAHLRDPRKLFYMTMEEGLYEVDFTNLEAPQITTLRRDGNHGGSRNLPGVHGKGLYVAQGHLFYTNNGQGEGFAGGLVEWDGMGNPEDKRNWKFVDTKAQYTEVTSRRGPTDMDPATMDAVWATGWDDASLFINVRTAETGAWTKFRLPQSSYTHSHPNGWYTEWPRIRDVGLPGGYLLSHHGMLFLVPAGFCQANSAGILPLTTHHKMIVDYVDYGDQIVFAANDASMFENRLVPKANSNLLFVDKADLASYGGRPAGSGGVWTNADLPAGTNSDPFLIAGFSHRVIHFAHDGAAAVDFVVEVDALGNSRWTPHATVTVPGARDGGYAFLLLPRSLAGHWIRFRPQQAVQAASVQLHLSSGSTPPSERHVASLASPRVPAARSQGVLRSNGEGDFKLEFAAELLNAEGAITGTGFYRAQLNPETLALELVAIEDAATEADVRLAAATTYDFGTDAASAFIDRGGVRYRFPKGNAAFDEATAGGPRRGIREVVTERDLVNLHGTFYELPRDFPGGGIRRIRPITTHDLDIFDFASWRGMLVLSGVKLGGAEGDGHCVQSDDGQVGLWFGNVDDLWSFGPPRGEGGPWKETLVAAGEPSDPYLMAGYPRKQLALSHAGPEAVGFLIEVDFLGTGQWEKYATFSVGPGETQRHLFLDGYAAHWVRVTSDAATTATAWFTYEPAAQASSAAQY
jgi:hypothetical protein